MALINLWGSYFSRVEEGNAMVRPFRRGMFSRVGLQVGTQLAPNDVRPEVLQAQVKQHLRIKHFLGNNENAVKTQVWCAVATYVLIAIVKKELHLNASLYTCLQILSVSVFEKTEISCALQADDSAIELSASANQLNLFDI